MRKPRKGPDEKIKKFDKKQLLLLPIAATIGLITGFIITQLFPGTDILKECLTSDDQPFNKIAHLEVILDGKPMDIKPNLGYDKECIRPIHLHGINEIHVAYKKEIKVTLYDLIRLLNIDLNKYEHTIYIKLSNSNDYLPFRGNLKSITIEDGMNIRITLKTK